MRLVDLREQRLHSALVNTSVPRAALDISMAIEQIKPLIEDIRREGAAAATLSLRLLESCRSAALGAVQRPGGL